MRLRNESKGCAATQGPGRARRLRRRRRPVRPSRRAPPRSGSPRVSVAWDASTAASSTRLDVARGRRDRRGLAGDAAGGPHGAPRHPVLGQRPGLVRADDRGRAQRLHGGEALDEARWRAMRWTPSASARVRVGSKPFRDVGHDHAEGEDEALVHATGSRSRRRGRRSSHRKRRPACVTMRVTRAISRCSGLGGLADGLGEVGDGADLGGHAGRAHHVGAGSRTSRWSRQRPAPALGPGRRRAVGDGARVA